jgi:hypothetical protein
MHFNEGYVGKEIINALENLKKNLIKIGQRKIQKEFYV